MSEYISIRNIDIKEATSFIKILLKDALYITRDGYFDFTYQFYPIDTPRFLVVKEKDSKLGFNLYVNLSVSTPNISDPGFIRTTLFKAIDQLGFKYDYNHASDYPDCFLIKIKDRNSERALFTCYFKVTRTYKDNSGFTHHEYIRYSGETSKYIYQEEDDNFYRILDNESFIKKNKKKIKKEYISLKEDDTISNKKDIELYIAALEKIKDKHKK